MERTRYAALDRKNNLYCLTHYHGWFTHNHWNIGTQSGMSGRTDTILGIGDKQPDPKFKKFIHASDFQGLHVFIKKNGQPHKMTEDSIVCLWKLDRGAFIKIFPKNLLGK